MFPGLTWSKLYLRKWIFSQLSELSQKQCQSFARIQSSKILLSQNIVYVLYWENRCNKTMQHVRATVSETEQQVIGISWWCCTDTIFVGATSVQHTRHSSMSILGIISSHTTPNWDVALLLHWPNCVSATQGRLAFYTYMLLFTLKITKCWRNADDLPLCFTDRCTYMLHCFVAPVFPIQDIYDVLGQQNFALLYCLHINKSVCKRLTLFLTEFTKLWENQFVWTRFWPSQAWEHSCKLSLDHVHLKVSHRIHHT